MRPPLHNLGGAGFSGNSLPLGMPSLLRPTVPSRMVNRAEVAAHRHPSALRSLESCHLCAHHCGVNRNTGQRGVCKVGARSNIFSAQIEVSDELELIPTYAIAFSGCDMRCSFCITGAESWNPSAGTQLDAFQIARNATAALENGARSVMILGGEPTVHLPDVLELVTLLPEDAYLIWKTNAHASSQSRDYLQGLFDCWLVDYKFGNDTCALNLSGTRNYSKVIQENLQFAHRNSELIIRHLLMPGHVYCCWQKVATWIASFLPEVKVHLMLGFWPAWQSHKHSEFDKRTPPTELEDARKIAEKLNLRLIE